MQKGILNRNSVSRPANRWLRQDWVARLTQESGMRAAAYVQALLSRLTVANSGAVAAEYTFLIAFISIISAIGMVLMGDDLKVYFEDLATALGNASAPTPDPFAT